MAPSRSPAHETSFKVQTTLSGSFGQNLPQTLFTTKNANRITKTQPSSKPKSKSTKSLSSRRVLTDVLLAIKPEHLENIANRKKNHEYRKYRLRDGVTRIWFYETREGGAGRSAITHIAVIPESLRHTPGSVPEEPFGIGNHDFNAGLKQSKYGYPVLELYELVRPVTLAEMKSQWGLNAPMGWQYVERQLWEDRWGMDNDRANKVKLIF
ncbi:hypothetical protein N7478_000958 [Penicillium angulare]|uniref:uncharacterized protein n=1 Tax=Penicillium angulare TaxID=116970 RepID=UPI0025408206|nr:uncharacterized protein N7478_000958 [Penicillium angulare]KAJ5291707.1 hypothetical protein N7478_000958 [Penicillium angulare]